MLASGVEVISVDNLVCGRLKNLDEFKNDPNFNFVQADIRDRKALFHAMEGVDWVFHLAGLADIVPSIENPSLYFDMNVKGTLQVLECAQEIGVGRFLYAASSSSYGIPDNYPTGETAPINPQYPYALTKYKEKSLFCIGRNCINSPRFRCGFLMFMVLDPELLERMGPFLESF